MVYYYAETSTSKPKNHDATYPGLYEICDGENVLRIIQDETNVSGGKETVSGKNMLLVKKCVRKLITENKNIKKKDAGQKEKINKLKKELTTLKKNHRVSLKKESNAVKKCEKLNNKIEALKKTLKISKKKSNYHESCHNKVIKDTKKVANLWASSWEEHGLSRFSAKLHGLEETKPKKNKIHGKSMEEAASESDEQEEETSYYIFKAYDKGNHTSDANYVYGFNSFEEALEQAEDLKSSCLSNGTMMQHLAIFQEGEEGGSSDWAWSREEEEMLLSDDEYE